MSQQPQVYLRLIPFVILAHFVAQSVSTGIQMFSDAACNQSLKNFTGPNGYTDGSCTSFSKWAPGIHLSFQVDGLDPGCNVAIYGNDTSTSICSSTIVVIAEVGRCYNASWVYYSIDGCIAPEETPSAETNDDQSSSTGAIVGGVIGGVVVVASVIGAFLYSRRSRKLQREIQAHNAQLRQDLYELASKRQPVESLERRSPVEMEADTGFAPVAVKTSVLPSGDETEQMAPPKRDQERRD